MEERRLPGAVGSDDRSQAGAGDGDVRRRNHDGPPASHDNVAPHHGGGISGWIAALGHGPYPDQEIRVVLIIAYSRREMVRVHVARGIAGAAALVAMVAASGCGDAARDDSGRLQVVVTHGILADVVTNVVGDAGDVETLMPRSVDPHAFEPSARQISAVHQADLVVANGLGLESSLVDVLADAADDGVPVFEVAPELDPIRLRGGALDPHVWTDPTRMAAAAREIADQLDRVEPDPTWREEAEQFASVLTALDGEIRQALASIPADRRRLVTNHEVFGYFASRYDFEVIGVVIPGGTTLSEPSARDLAALADTIRDSGVRAIFGETSQGNELADALRREVGEDVSVVELFTESLGAPGSVAGTYVGMMRENADRIAAALTP